MSLFMVDINGMTSLLHLVDVDVDVYVDDFLIFLSGANMATFERQLQWVLCLVFFGPNSMLFLGGGLKSPAFLSPLGLGQGFSLENCLQLLCQLLS